MKLRNILVLALLFNYASALLQDTLEVHNLPMTAGKASDTFIQNTLMEIDLPVAIDNHFDDAHIHLKSIAGYGVPNPYVMSVLGSSPSWTNFRYHEINNNNILRPGDARYHFNLNQSHLAINQQTNQIIQSPEFSPDNLFQTHLTIGGLGGRVRFSDWFINNISGHESAKQREIFNIEKRSKSNWSNQIVYHNNRSEKPIRIHFSVGSRSHLDPNHVGIITPYNELYTQVVGQIILNRKERPLKHETGILFGSKLRSNDLAEFNYNMDETRQSKELHITLYKKKPNKALAINFDYQKLRKTRLDITRNIIDQDGEGLEPFYQDGNQYAVSLDYQFQKKLTKGHQLSLLGDLQNSVFAFRPANRIFQTNFFRQTNAVDYLSLHTIFWESNPFSAGILKNELKLNYIFNSKNLSWKSHFGIQGFGLLIRDQSIIDTHPLADFSLLYKLSKKWSLGFFAAYQGNAFTINEAKYLSSDHLIGQAYYWHDSNQDLVFTADERGKRSFGTGGIFREKSADLGASSTIQVECPIIFDNNAGFRFSISPQYRQFRNTWHTQFKNDAANYGEFITTNGASIFYLHSETTTLPQYAVVPYPKERIHTGNDGENGFFFNQPFYAGVTLKGQKQTDDLFFSASFTANMVVGASGMGNGPLHNSVHTLSESTADPNLITNNTGRLDADRSFISRWLLAYNFSNNDRCTLQIKYKDGQSFANYEHFIRHTQSGNQIAFIQREVRGDNPLTGIRGRREDFLMNVDFRYHHDIELKNAKLRLEFHGYNLLDFANETLEYVFGNVNGFDRAPLELQIPRSILIQVSYFWN